MSVDDTKRPSLPKKAMLSGSGVSAIQNCTFVSPPNRNTIPSAPDRSVTPIRPCSCWAAVSAAHRHTSHVEPSEAVTRPATVENPEGATRVVVVGPAADDTDPADA